MARARSVDRAPSSLHRSLSTPGLYVWRMFVFLVLVGLLVAVLHRQLWEAMLNNPGLNLLICFVLLSGVLYAFQQVLRLYPEIRWVNAFRIADPGLAISHRPVLLSPMATMLRDRTGSLSLPGGPLGLSRLAGNLLGVARHHPVGGQGDQCSRYQGRRQRRRVR